ncbi:MAG: TRAP transporter small permease [Paracoccaceae bacterium]
MLDRILKLWSRIETAIIGLLVICALFTFLGGAALRVLTPQHAVDWAEEVALYFIIWGTALSGSVLAAESHHINTEIIVNALPPRLRRAIGLAVTALCLVFCALVAKYGWEGYLFSAMLDDRSASSLRTPQSWALFLALPVGMGLMVIRIALLAWQGKGITTAAEGGKS